MVVFFFALSQYLAYDQSLAAKKILFQKHGVIWRLKLQGTKQLAKILQDYIVFLSLYDNLFELNRAPTDVHLK